MKLSNLRTICLLTLGCLTLSAYAETIVAGRFSQGDLNGWERKSFKGDTQYQIVTDPQLQRKVLQASTQGKASGRYRKITIDLTKTPYMSWSWKVANTYPGVNERTKGGDDYPARVYVVAESGVLGLSTRALSYVWSSNQPAGSRWPNAFSNQAVIWAVNSGNAQVGQWVSQKRNIRNDLKAAFGKDFTEINAVAVMTDADNAGGSATAWYGDIVFSDR